MRGGRAYLTLRETTKYGGTALAYIARRRCRHVDTPGLRFSVFSATRVRRGRMNEADVNEWEGEYSDLRINWFPGHMVKAANTIREKLKHVDMVFEIRDARAPFSSANADLDRIVGPRKARLIVLNKADLANPRLQQLIVARFEAEGKAAVFACGKTGANINKLLLWAREQGAKRGEFTTTGSIAMVVGMPNVGKSSLINLLKGKATRGPGGGGEHAKQVATIGATPGITRHVSAFCIATKPPLYLVDTPGVMVPKVDSPTIGLRLALIRAVPDATVPRDMLVGFMLRLVRARRPLRFSVRERIIAAKAEAISSKQAADATAERDDAVVDNDQLSGGGSTERSGKVSPIQNWLQRGGLGPVYEDDSYGEAADSGIDGSSRKGQNHTERSGFVKEREWWEEEVEALLLQVERESGAVGKEPDARRRICCQYLLDAFWEGQFGKITMDNLVVNVSPTVTSSRSVDADETKRRTRKDRRRVMRGVGQHSEREPRTQEWLPANLDRDWSSPDAWEVAEKGS